MDIEAFIPYGKKVPVEDLAEFISAVADVDCASINFSKRKCVVHFRMKEYKEQEFLAICEYCQVWAKDHYFDMQFKRFSHIGGNYEIIFLFKYKLPSFIRNILGIKISKSDKSSICI